MSSVNKLKVCIAMKLNKTLDKESEFRKFIFSNDFVPSQGEKWREIRINAPKICPICSSKGINKEHKFLRVCRFPTKLHAFYALMYCKKHFKTRILLNLNFELYAEKSVIWIKNDDWAEEFRRLNECTEFTGDLTPSHELAIEFTRALNKTFFTRIAIVVSCIIFALFLNIFIDSFLYGIIIAIINSTILGIIVIDIIKKEIHYFIMEYPKKRAEIYFSKD